MNNQWGKSQLTDDYFQAQDDKNKYYRELIDKLPFYKTCITSEELSSMHDEHDIKYPDRYDQNFWEESTQGDWIACSDVVIT